jgi:hypothetical protein
VRLAVTQIKLEVLRAVVYKVGQERSLAIAARSIVRKLGLKQART